MNGIYAPIRYHRAYEFTCPNCGTEAHGMYQIAEVEKGKSAPPLDHDRMVCTNVRGRPAGQIRAERFNPIGMDGLPSLWQTDHGCGRTLAAMEKEAAGA